MKSERRHELQQNDLAIYLDRINKSVEPYSKMIAVVVVVVIIGGVGYSFYKAERTGARSQATLELVQASAVQDAEEMLRVSEAFPDTAASAWARLYQGKLYLSQGINALYDDRNNAEQLLGDAEAAFRYAISTSNDPLLRSRAHFGIGRAAESLGNIDEAIEAYQEVIAVNESEAMVKKAEERIQTLSSPNSQAFLAWFADQDFSPSDPSLPPALPGGGTLPDLPDFKLPDLSLSSDEDDMELKDGGLEMPAKDADKVDASKDEAKDAVKEESEASQETPATNPPADEKAEEKEPAKEAAKESADDKPAAESGETDPADSQEADEKGAGTEPADGDGR